MGTPEFAVGALEAIHQSHHEVLAVVTAPDKPAGRGLKLKASEVKEYALAHQLPVLQPEKLRDENFLAQLRALNADIFVVVAFRMLPEVVYAMPPFGTFNIHASLLPNYRGVAPIHWAVMNGETRTGVTSFFLNHQIDMVHREQLLELFHQGVLRLDEDAFQRFLVQGVEMGYDGQTPHDFGDKAVFLQVGRREVLQHIVLVEGLVASSAIADDVGALACGDEAFDAIKGPAGDEEDIFCVDGHHGLFGVFATTFGRYVHD